MHAFFSPPASDSYPVITIDTDDDGAHHTKLFAGPLEDDKVWEGTPEELVALVLNAKEVSDSFPFSDIPGPTGSGRFETAVKELMQRVQ